MLIYFRSLGLTYPSVQEILHLKFQHLTCTAQSKLEERVTDIGSQEQQKGNPLRHSSGKWNESALDDFLMRKARDLSDYEQWHLTHIGEAEQKIFDRVCTKYNSWLLRS